MSSHRADLVSDAVLLAVIGCAVLVTVALWRVGSRSFVVQHYRSRLEGQLTNTDTGMRATSSRMARG